MAQEMSNDYGGLATEPAHSESWHPASRPESSPTIPSQTPPVADRNPFGDDSHIPEVPDATKETHIQEPAASSLNLTDDVPSVTPHQAEEIRDPETWETDAQEPEPSSITAVEPEPEPASAVVASQPEETAQVGIRQEPNIQEPEPSSMVPAKLEPEPITVSELKERIEETKEIEDASSDTHDFFGDSEDPEDGLFDLTQPQRIARTVTDPFLRDDVIGRTNSFPVLDSSTSGVAFNEEPELVPSTNGDLHHEDELRPEDVPSTNGFTADDEAHEVLPWDNDGDEYGEGFFQELKTQTKPIYVPEAESRFEEGMPLVDEHEEPQVETQSTQQNSLDSIFGQDNSGDGDEFFGSQPAPVKEPLHLTRKSTSQVLDSLSFAQDSSVVESPHVESPFASNGEVPDHDHPAETSVEDDLAERWKAMALDDDDDLLMDDEDTELPDASTEEDQASLLAQLNAASSDGHAGASQSQAQSSNPYVPNSSQIPQPSTANPYQPQSSLYTPHQPSSAELVQGLPPPNYSGGAAAGLTPPKTVPGPRQQLQKAQSFSDLSADGYRSPYDLPSDLIRPRKHAAPRGITNPVPLPSRSSSIPVPPPASGPPLGPPLGPQPMTSQPGSVAVASSTVPKPSPPTDSFFAELPIAPRTRPASSGRYTPQQTMAAPPAPSVIPPPQPAAGNNQQPSEADDPYGLQQPARMDLYANLSAPPPPAAPGANSRYSPKPPSLQSGGKAASPRYSPAPPPQTTVPPNRARYASQPTHSTTPTVLPFQPRTSSPLAHHEKHAYQHQPPIAEGEPVASHLSPPPNHIPNLGLSQPFHGDGSEMQTNSEAVPVSDQPAQSPTLAKAPQEIVSPPRNRYAPVSIPQQSLSPPSLNAAVHMPLHTGLPLSQSAPDSQFSPPRRSQTSSPGKQIPGPYLAVTSHDPLPRPASVHDPSSPTRSVNPYAVSQQPAHNRGLSQQLEFIPPTDGQQFDPLERWRGAPVIHFGFGGTVTTSFPKHVPRYTAGNPTPMIKPTLGEIRINQVEAILPPVDGIVKFPGPLKNKSKKKDVLAWLSSRIVAFENEGLLNMAGSHPDAYKRYEEKILLWKIMRILVEHDGTLEGNPEIAKALRSVISPRVDADSSEDQAMGGLGLSAATYQATNASPQADSVDSKALDNVRQSLLTGEKEKAVWSAVDSRMWGHAMLISSVLDKSVWKQVVQEFVRREVRSIGDNTESLAALYEIFAGNVEESVDELVPPSARAGLQMMSKVAGPGPAKNSLDGLDRWRETLGLVLSNRSSGDQQALAALGRLLSHYGRVEAAHICYLFARSPNLPVFGGADDPQANIVLFGVDHRLHPSSYANDEDGLLLTEVYEFAVSILAGSPSNVLPHFQAYKLHHVLLLAERGQQTESQQYCDTIAAILKASTKPSPYYHPGLFAQLDELSYRLRQAPSDGSSSWRPSMEKVSGSLMAKFNSFIAGDDSDGVSNGSGKPTEDVGPFAKMTGTPTISRSPSTTDLYGSYPLSHAQTLPATSAPSRYAPGNQYAPNASPENVQGRSSLDSQRSLSYGGVPYGQRRSSYEPMTPVETNPYQPGTQNTYSSPSAMHSTPPQTSYVPLAPVEEDLSPQSQPNPPGSQHIAFGGYKPDDTFGEPLATQMSSAYMAPTSGYEPSATGSGYEPPSYEPDLPAANTSLDEPVHENPTNAFMDVDDDDDMAARAAAIQKAERARKDREADEAFRKAAEEDAKKPLPAKKGWFGGWFAGGKKEPDSSTPGKPIRAKLGEENSFYYDTDLKKWVNKKDPNSATVSASATPPPPRGSAPPSRSASGSGPTPSLAVPLPANSGPPSMVGSVPSRGSSPAVGSFGAPMTSSPNLAPRSISTDAPPLARPGTSGSGTGLAPPPRPSTSLSTASSIDDLIGAPQARKGNTLRGKKKGRGYIDVMAK